MLPQRTVSYEQFKEEPDRKYILGFNSGEDVVLHFREDGIKQSLRIEKYPWYFCVTVEDYNKNKAYFDKLTDSLTIKHLEIGKNYVKIFARNINKKVMDERHQLMIDLTEKKIQHYEADLSSLQRCLVDNKLKIEDSYRVLYFDIETDDRHGGIVIGRDRILSIAGVDRDGKTYYYTSKDEKKLLKKFLDRIEEYDVIAGWNSEKFDVPYIRERLKKHNIWYNWSEILQLDMMQKTMELNKRNVDLIKEVRGFSLNAIAKHFLGEEKVVHEMGIYEMFEKDPALLKKYNIQDCVLLKRLDDKLKIVTQKVVEHQITGCFLNEFAVSRVLDIYTLRNANKFGDIRFRSKPEWGTVSFDPNKEAGYVGGYVIDPMTGLHTNIYHFDFTSLYPSIIQTFNISPETWVRHAEEDEVQDSKFIYTPNKQVFKRQVGIIPKIIGELLKARDAIRKVEMKKHEEGTAEYERLYYQQYAFKTIANSFYGILGAPFTRYYKLEVAEGITRSGHYLIKLVKKWFEDEGHTVIYGDTDSVFVKSDKVLDEQDVYKRINVFIDYHLSKHFGIIDSHIDLKLEDHYTSMLMVGKKKYVKNKNGELKVVGLELRRRETLPITAKAQKELLDLLLLKKTKIEEVFEWVNKLKEKVTTAMTKDELTLQMKLSKHIDEYAKKIKDDLGDVIGYKPSVLAHAKVANWLKENQIQENGANTWEKGCYVKYIVTNHKPKVEAISIYQYEGQYDHAYYWNVKVYAVLQRTLECVFPNLDWKTYLIEVPKKKRERVSKKQSKMFDFIKEDPI